MATGYAANRAHWNRKSDSYQRTHDGVIGAAPKLWGAHGIPDSELGAIGDTAGLAVLELGCGAAQWSSALAAEGALVTGLDLSEAQLDAARQRGPELCLVQAAGEHLPFRGRAFDLVFCDHGALGWADPAIVLPGVAAVLRPGGRLVFNVASPFNNLCWDDVTGGLDTQLTADYFGFTGEIAADGSRWFALGYGEWVRVLRTNGFVIDDLIEPRPSSPRANTYWSCEPEDWFMRWPGECLYVTHLEDAPRSVS